MKLKELIKQMQEVVDRDAEAKDLEVFVNFTGKDLPQHKDMPKKYIELRGEYLNG